MAQHQQIYNQHEFLPLCDVLFNIISLVSYFCDIVFDLAMAYALYANYPTTPTVLFPLSIGLVLTSLLISQIVSLRWYLWGARGKLNNPIVQDTNTNICKKNYSNWKLWCVVFLHGTQIAVLWRYFKLFIPVNLTYVKHEVRELCILRLIHAFCEAAPMMLLKLYLFVGLDKNELNEDNQDMLEIQNPNKLAELTTVSVGFSLWSVCWALASFSKGAARLRNLERLVLTWLGVLAQLVWRLGTVSARVGALIAYASLYGGQGLIIVILLHWLLMLTWLMSSPHGLFNDNENLSIGRKTFLASLTSFIYVFAYVNLHETKHRQKMLLYYIVMFMENSLLIGIWTVNFNPSKIQPAIYRYPEPVLFILISLALFFGGLCFMGLYYRYFHVRRIRYEAGGRMNITNTVTTLTSNDNHDDKNYINNDDKKIQNNSIGMRKIKLNNNGIPGVFNCRFTNQTVVNLNRKKKKPTTFIPPPSSEQQHQNNITSNNIINKPWINCDTTKQTTPFWKRPLSIIDTNDIQTMENEQNHDIDLQVSSLNIDLIHEKLREKKQQQLRELRKIEEEIKEGKLVVPSASTSSFSSSLSATNQQPPPNTKLHNTPNGKLPEKTNVNNSGILTTPKITTITTWPPIKMHCLHPPISSSPYHPKNNNNNNPPNGWNGLIENEQSDAPEILLAPRCLPHHHSHWTSGYGPGEKKIGKEGEPGEEEGEMSDMEGSQVSLPRVVTNNLSRERRCITNKTQSSRFYLPSTNSSDGDVDSADNEEETDSELQGNLKQQNNSNNVDNLSRRLTTVVNGDASYSSNNENDKSSTSMGSTSCYLNNSYVPRVNQILKSKTKHSRF